MGKKDLSDIESYKKWLQSLQGQRTRKPGFKTVSDLELKPLYIPKDSLVSDALDKLGFPGKYPFTRGVYPTMYRGRLWTMRQYAGFGDAKSTNQRYHYLLSQGQTGLSVAFDLPTQIGYDSDHPIAEGEVGKVGVAISTIEDMNELFAGIPLEKISTSMTINSTASILLAMYISLAKKQGISSSRLSGTIQNDILKEYVARGTYRFPIEPSMRLITDIFAYCSSNLPRFNTISISGYHIREAGSDAVQEVAFTLSNAIAYVEAAIKAGLKPDDFGRRLSFFFGAHNHIFEEAAKFRAARRMWAKIMRQRFDCKDDKACMLRFHTQTAGCTLTYQQPYNNIIRVAMQALAAVLGGTQSLHTNSMDEAISLPSEFAVQIALRTQQIIAFESGAADVIDPLGGSPFIEELTDMIEEKATDYIEKIDSMGGAIEAIKKGYMQSEIQKTAYRQQLEMESADRIVVGVNRFTTDNEKDISFQVQEPSPQLATDRMNILSRFREARNNRKVNDALAKLESAAAGNANLMPYVIECVEAMATIGEICSALVNVFGEYQAEHQ